MPGVADCMFPPVFPQSPIPLQPTGGACYGSLLLPTILLYLQPGGVQVRDSCDRLSLARFQGRRAANAH
jgi:hypothetical protein